MNGKKIQAKGGAYWGQILFEVEVNLLYNHEFTTKVFSVTAKKVQDRSIVSSIKPKFDGES